MYISDAQDLIHLRHVYFGQRDTEVGFTGEIVSIMRERLAFQINE